jgi:hypothetical protein
MLLTAYLGHRNRVWAWQDAKKTLPPASDNVRK